MLVWFLLVLTSVLAVEVALRLPLSTTLSRLAKHGQRAAHILRSSRISDHWKEKAIPKHAFRIFKASLQLLVFLVLVLAPFIILDLLGRAVEADLLENLVTVWGTLASILIAFIYIALRRRSKNG